MNFKVWMVDQGLSEKSASSYSSAISGRLSDWAMQAGLLSHSLLLVSDRHELIDLIPRLETTSDYITSNKRGYGMYAAALKQYARFLSDAASSPLEDIELTKARKDISNTTKRSLVKARIGQGAFRKSLIDKWGSCAVTGLKVPSLLLASHIKPWSRSSDSERLEVNNGILLPQLSTEHSMGD